jgi:hypothetical protein
MKATRCVSLFVVLLCGPHLARAATETLTLRWGELGAAIGNQEVTVFLSGNVRIQGTAAQVEPDALLLTVRKTSDKQAYPKGNTSIPRARVSEVRLKRVKGPGRLIGAAGAGTAAGLGSLPWALSESRINVADSTRGGQWAGITAAAAVGGYFLGRLIDTKETIIHVAPEN